MAQSQTAHIVSPIVIPIILFVAVAGLIVGCINATSATVSSVGDGESVIQSGRNLKSLVAGTNMIITPEQNTLVFSSIDSTKSLTAGTGITIDGSSGEEVVISSNITLASVGTGESLVKTGTGATLETKSLTAGAGILVSASSQNEVSVSSNVTLSSVGTGESLVKTQTGANLQTKSLTAGTGILVAASGQNEVSVSSNVTLTSVGTGESLVKTQTGANLQTKSLTAGTGILVAASGQNEVSVSSNITLTSVGTGESLVLTETGANLQTKSLIAGTGMIVSASGQNEIKIQNDDPGSAVNIGTTSLSGASLISVPAGPDMKIRNILGSDNIAADEVQENVVLTLTSDLTNVNSISGATDSSINFAFADSVTIPSVNFYWMNQPWLRWNTGITDFSQNETINVGTLAFVPMAVSGLPFANFTPVNKIGSGAFTTSEGGENTLTTPHEPRQYRVTYTMTLDCSAATGVTRSLNFFIFTAPGGSPLSYQGENYVAIRFPTAGGSNYNFTVTDIMYLAQNYVFQLAYYSPQSSFAQNTLSFIGLTCTAAALLT